MSATTIMRARDLHLTFGQTRALRGVDLDIAAGEVLAVTGPSGSGKSTLLHVLAGVLVPDSGTVDYRATTVTALDEAARSRLRLHEFGFVFQFGQLLPDLSALDNVTVPLLLTGTPRRKALDAARAALDELGLTELAAERAMEALVGSVRARGASMVIITHDARTAAYADREVTVRDGRLTAPGPSAASPASAPLTEGGAR